MAARHLFDNIYYPFYRSKCLGCPQLIIVMSEYVPLKSHGRYFGWRNKIFSIVSVFCTFASGIILHIFRDNILKGFLFVFTAAFICRFVSWHFLTQMYQPSYRIKEDAYFNFFVFSCALGVLIFVNLLSLWQLLIFL